MSTTINQQLVMNHNATQMLNEEVYGRVSGKVTQALQKCLTIRGALDTFELKISQAVEELHAELKTIDSNFDSLQNK